MDYKKKFLEAEELFKEINKEREGNTTEKNTATIQKNKEKIWLILYDYIENQWYDKRKKEQIIYNHSDIKTVSYIIEKYDISKGHLENFVNSTWSRRQKPDRETQVKTKEMTSLDEPVTNSEEDDESTKGDFVPSKWEMGKVEDNIIWSIEHIENLVDMINAINQVCLMKNTKGNNNLQLIITDKITQICKFELMVKNKIGQNRESSIMGGINKTFLDFYMSEECRTLKKIHNTPLKKRNEIPQYDLKDKKNIELGLPLETEVYVCFLMFNENRSNRSSIKSQLSQAKAKYSDLLKKIGLQGNISRIYDLYHENYDIEQIKEKIGVKTWVLSLVVDEFDKKELTGIASVTDKVKDKMDALMIEHCGQIRKYYEKYKNSKEEFEKKEAEGYVKEFLKDWIENGYENYQIYKQKRQLEKKVAKNIEKLVVEHDFYKKSDENYKKEILKSLAYKFANREEGERYSLQKLIEMRADGKVRQMIVREISKENPKIDTDLIYDTIQVLFTYDKEKSKDLEKLSDSDIAMHVQNNHLYDYFWK